MRPAPAQIRWDRIARLALLAVLLVLLYLGVRAGSRILSTWHQAAQARAAVATLRAQNARLRAQRAALARPETGGVQARALGMVRPGELGFYVRGLPQD